MIARSSVYECSRMRARGDDHFLILCTHDARPAQAQEREQRASTFICSALLLFAFLPISYVVCCAQPRPDLRTQYAQNMSTRLLLMATFEPPQTPSHDCAASSLMRLFAHACSVQSVRRAPKE